MLTRRERIVLVAGVFCAACAGVLAAMLAARQSHLEQEGRAAEAAVGHGAPPSSGADSVLQLPKIVARSDRDGIVVVLSNDTSDRRVVIDPERNRLVVEYASVPAGPFVRRVSLDARTLAPGEATEPILIPLEGRWRSVRVRFEHRDNIGVHGTAVTIP